jgi:DNA-binding response OmpR family regulator
MPVGCNILIADPDPAARCALGNPLGRLGEFVVHEVESDSEVLASLARQPFDAFILDATLPESDGRELCRTLRRRGITSPILIMLDRASDPEVILALDAGANDCIVKSTSIGLFLARLRAHLRQHAQNDELDVRIQHCRFRPGARLLTDAAGRKKCLLTGREAILLKYLCRMRGITVPRAQLLRAVWEYNPDVTTHTIETHVWRLRKKLERDPRRPTILITEAGGYRLCMDASREIEPEGVAGRADPKPAQWRLTGLGRGRSETLSN